MELKVGNDESLEIGDLGKCIELTCDSNGQIYVICKHITNDGPNISIFELNIVTGEVSEAIMNDQLVSTIEYDVNRPSF